MSAVDVSTQYHTEIIDGREVLKPLPKKLHILVQTYLTGILLRDLAKQYRVMPELNVLCGNSDWCRTSQS